MHEVARLRRQNRGCSCDGRGVSRCSPTTWKSKCALVESLLRSSVVCVNGQRNHPSQTREERTLHRKRLLEHVRLHLLSRELLSVLINVVQVALEPRVTGNLACHLKVDVLLILRTGREAFLPHELRQCRRIAICTVAKDLTRLDVVRFESLTLAHQLRADDQERANAPSPSSSASPAGPPPPPPCQFRHRTTSLSHPTSAAP